MTRAVVDEALQESDLVRLRGPVRRYLGRVVADEHDLDDLVQETLLRLWEVRGRVDRAGAAAYAIATARNLEASRRRASALHDRHAHRLHEPGTVDGPEQETLRREEHRAVGEALAGLEVGDRDLLAEEYGDRPARSVDRTARRRSQLARARSRARVDYLLRLRRLHLPTQQCRPVLEALSSGDRREHERARVEEHLASCHTCAGCADALRSRERSLFGVVAVPVLALLVLLRPSPRASAGAGAVAVAVAGVLVLGQHSGRTTLPRVAVPPAPAVAADPAVPPAPAVPADPAVPPAPAVPAGPAVPAAPAPRSAPLAPLRRAPAGPVPSAPRPVPGLELTATDVPATLGSGLGRTVVARDVLVLSVPADEGFFVGPDRAHRVFVRLTQAGESTLTVRAGQHLSFVGTVQPVTPQAVDGVTTGEGLASIRSAGGVVDTAASSLTVR